jgi:hypothetical protein
VTLGRKTLAALGTACGNDLAAADRGNAGPKAMTALTDEFARLIGTLHDEYSKRKNEKFKPPAIKEATAKVNSRQDSLNRQPHQCSQAKRTIQTQ